MIATLLRRAAIGACLAAALFVAPGGGAAALAGGDKPAFQRGPDFQKRVDDAIAFGVQWLRRAERADGAFPEEKDYPGGSTALAYHTLRVCKVPADDDAAKLAFAAMGRAYAALRPKKGSAQSGLRTYSAALMCMALASHGLPASEADASGERTCALNDDDARWMKELVDYLEGTQDSSGRWSLGVATTPDSTSYDNRDTQWALLGLEAASRAGVRVKTTTWLKSLQHFIGSQEPSGPKIPRDESAAGAKSSGAAGAFDRARGWGYGSISQEPNFWMTAAGVGSVVLCRSEVLADPKCMKVNPGLDGRAETSARDGLAYVGRKLDDSYYIDPSIKRSTSFTVDYAARVFAVGRAGDLAGVDKMGAHDWYGEGAECLVAAQRERGAWGEDYSPGEQVMSTCFALLFLARDTPPVARGSLKPALDDSDIDFAAAPTLPDKDFADFLDLVLSRWRRISDAAVKERLFAKTTAVGPRIVPPLVKRLASDKDDERFAAIALLKRATGLDHGYDPSATPEARGTAVAAWTAWWTANEKTLRYDAATGRLIP